MYCFFAWLVISFPTLLCGVSHAGQGILVAQSPLTKRANKTLRPYLSSQSPNSPRRTNGTDSNSNRAAPSVPSYLFL